METPIPDPKDVLTTPEIRSPNEAFDAFYTHISNPETFHLDDNNRRIGLTPTDVTLLRSGYTEQEVVEVRTQLVDAFTRSQELNNAFEEWYDEKIGGDALDPNNEQHADLAIYIYEFAEQNGDPSIQKQVSKMREEAQKGYIRKEEDPDQEKTHPAFDAFYTHISNPQTFHLDDNNRRIGLTPTDVALLRSGRTEQDVVEVRTQFVDKFVQSQELNSAFEEWYNEKIGGDALDPNNAQHKDLALYINQWVQIVQGDLGIRQDIGSMAGKVSPEKNTKEFLPFLEFQDRLTQFLQNERLLIPIDKAIRVSLDFFDQARLDAVGPTLKEFGAQGIVHTIEVDGKNYALKEGAQPEPANQIELIVLRYIQREAERLGRERSMDPEVFMVAPRTPELNIVDASGQPVERNNIFAMEQLDMRKPFGLRSLRGDLNSIQELLGNATKFAKCFWVLNEMGISKSDTKFNGDFMRSPDGSFRYIDYGSISVSKEVKQTLMNNFPELIGLLSTINVNEGTGMKFLDSESIDQEQRGGLIATITTELGFHAHEVISTEYEDFIEKIGKRLNTVGYGYRFFCELAAIEFRGSNIKEARDFKKLTVENIFEYFIRLEDMANHPNNAQSIAEKMRSSSHLGFMPWDDIADDIIQWSGGNFIDTFGYTPQGDVSGAYHSKISSEEVIIAEMNNLREMQVQELETPLKKFEEELKGDREYVVWMKKVSSALKAREPSRAGRQLYDEPTDIPKEFALSADYLKKVARLNAILASHEVFRVQERWEKNGMGTMAGLWSGTLTQEQVEENLSAYKISLLQDAGIFKEDEEEYQRLLEEMKIMLEENVVKELEPVGRTVEEVKESLTTAFERWDVESERSSDDYRGIPTELIDAHPLLNDVKGYAEQEPARRAAQ